MVESLSISLLKKHICDLPWVCIVRRDGHWQSSTAIEPNDISVLHVEETSNPISGFGMPKSTRVKTAITVGS